MQAIHRPVFRDVMQDVFPFSVERIFSNGEPGVWYDVSDLSTLFQDRAGTIPVTAIGQTVGRILDKSGRGNHLTANSDGARGLYQADDAGRPFVLFDGVDDGYITPTITPGTDKAQIFAGVRKFTGVGTIVELSAAIGSNAGIAFEANTTGEIVSTGPVGARSFATWTNVQPSTSVFSVCADRAGTTAAAEWPAIRRNGVQVSATYTLNGGSVGNFGAFPLYVGRRGGTSQPFNGRIYTLIVRFGPNLDVQRLRQVERYVAEKTGVSV
jgi:hypothetical protein